MVWEQSTRRVLCLDYLPGIKVNDREALLEAGIDPSAVAEIGAASYLKQLVRFGFFHADPHPGNLAVASDGALIYYDFGMMGLLQMACAVVSGRWCGRRRLEIPLPWWRKCRRRG